MVQNDWNNYFKTRYKPIKEDWGIDDLRKYRSWYKNWVPYICNLLPKEYFTKPRRGLEIGAGIGAFSSLLEDFGVKMTMCDIAKNMISASKIIQPDKEYLLLDIQKKLKVETRYDLLFSIEVLEHLSELSQALNTIYSLLLPGGYLVATTPYPYKKNMTDTTHVNVHKPDFWSKILKKHGFDSIILKPLSSFPFLWQIDPRLNLIFPWNNPLPLCISTTVIIARKAVAVG